MEWIGRASSDDCRSWRGLNRVSKKVGKILEPFAKGLERRERRNLTGLTGTLLERGGEVHDVLYQFARGLKPFVPTCADGELCLARLGTTYGAAGRSSVGFA
ncbi:MAG: hypothetical protein KFB96_05730 [Thiocapsa sp.]|uniref:hypothetical protein n=1 Tax=Thiocapsa sp. TaxID=2024551 RepID=UPI001BD19832|nr:hypothetical protein [Thiocapsa sp.]QVL49978.1 MAG: hypothetical protein KFB96_05730 [Thiocapsa sp.]